MSPTRPLWVSPKLTQPASCVLLIRHLPPAVSMCAKMGYTSKTQFRSSALCWHICHNPLFWLCFCFGAGNLLILTQNFFLHTSWSLTWKVVFYWPWECTLLCCPWMELGIFSTCQSAASFPLDNSSRVQPGHRQVGLCDFAPSEMEYFDCTLQKVWDNLVFFMW